MSTRALSPAVAALAERKKPKINEDRLQRIREKIAIGRSLDADIEDHESRLKDLKKKRYELLTTELPTLFEGAGIDRLGLDASGNLPAYDARLKPHFKAVLPPKEEPERRQAALDLLSEKEAGDLSTTEVAVHFERGEEKKLAKLRSFLDKHRMHYLADTGVHWGMLTAWVKECFQSRRPLSQDELTTLGATVGKIVELKKRKENI